MATSGGRLRPWSGVRGRGGVIQVWTARRSSVTSGRWRAPRRPAAEPLSGYCARRALERTARRSQRTETARPDQLRLPAAALELRAHTCHSSISASSERHRNPLCRPTTDENSTSEIKGSGGGGLLLT